MPVLCIDGDEKYIGILKRNVAQYSNVSVCHALVGGETGDTNLSLKKERGTAIVGESSIRNQMRTIDHILKDFSQFEDSKLIKVDTDGFDTIILKACASYLRKRKPILFFEFDPYLTNQQNDDPFSFIPYLKECGYQYLVFYMSNGDYLLSSDINDEKTITELVHYFSGRKVELYTDICAFSGEDKDIFDITREREVQFFRKARNY